LMRPMRLLAFFIPPLKKAGAGVRPPLLFSKEE